MKNDFNFRKIFQGSSLHFDKYGINFTNFPLTTVKPVYLENFYDIATPRYEKKVTSSLSKIISKTGLIFAVLFFFFQFCRECKNKQAPQIHLIRSTHLHSLTHALCMGVYSPSFDHHISVNRVYL